MHRNGPKPSKDPLWDEVSAELPYTNASSAYKTDPFFGSTTAMDISAKQGEWTAEQQMPPIDEEAAVGGFPAPVENRLRRHRQNKKGEELANIDSVDSTKDEIEDGSNAEEDDSSQADERSNSSIQYEEEKSRRGGLTGLLMGVSRQTLSSRSGSKNSLSRLSIKRSSNSKFSSQRSPSSSLALSKSRIKKLRGSSPIISNHRDGIPDEILSDRKDDKPQIQRIKSVELYNTSNNVGKL